MSSKNDPPKENTVKNVFDRKTKKRHSSLFTPSSPVDDTKKPVEKPRTKKDINKKFSFGLDIGTSAIKIVQLGKSHRGEIQAAKAIIKELPKEIQLEKPEARISLLNGILKNLLHENDLAGECFVAAPWALLQMSLMKLPSLSKDEIEDAVRWEIKQHHQMDISDISYDYILCEKQQKYFGNQTKVLTISLPKKNIFEYLTIFESCKVYPSSIESESLANVAALNYAGMLGKEETVLVLDFGSGKSFVNIVSCGELLFTRIIHATGNNLTQSISEKCKVTWEAAEVMKKRWAYTGSDSQESSSDDNRGQTIREITHPFIENIMQDLEHTSKYFYFQIMQSQITHFDKIILTGGSSCLSGLSKTLKDRFQVPVEVVDLSPWRLDIEEGVGGEEKKQEEFSAQSRRMNVAFGLALRGIEER